MRWLATVIAFAVAMLWLARPADAHVGSPDVFFDGDAGPYALAVTVRVPQVIPGVAELEIRSASPDVSAMTVVPLRLTGPGSELPPTPDVADRSADDPQFFTASLWLMESGSLQVRIAVDGARGHGELAVPIPAAAQRTLPMDRGLGTLLLALMLVLALAVIAILGAAVREAALEPGAQPAARARRAAAIMIASASIVVAGLLWFGNSWWNDDAAEFASHIGKPWQMAPRVDGCTLRIPNVLRTIVPDHGHDMHLFVARVPDLGVVAHLHPALDPATAELVEPLPPLPAGRYALFGDVVMPSGFPVTGTAQLDLPDLSACAPAGGDDATWAGEPAPDVRFDAPPGGFHAGIAGELRFHAVDGNGRPATDVRAYMGMAGHAMVVRDDLGVFAHLHPYGSVAMPALMMAGTPHAMYGDAKPIPPDLAFPYGFPTAGRYHVFLQLRRAGGRIETVAVPVEVLP
jgi:hypothetical protein|nr:hypothetical protein [Kofleriaceae bacterium]